MKTLKSTSGKMVKGYQEYMNLEQHEENGQTVFIIAVRRFDTPTYADIKYRSSNYGQAMQQWQKLSDQSLTICD